MLTLLNVLQIIISIILIVVILLQAKGAGGLGGIFGGGDSSVFRTRRGIEKILFQITIVLAAVFVVISLLTVRVAS